MKDQFHMKGMETTMAYVGWVGTFEGKKGTGKEGRVESELVMELNSLGAIPIGKVSRTRNLPLFFPLVYLHDTDYSDHQLMGKSYIRRPK